jgi:hypothetical protein
MRICIEKASGDLIEAQSGTAEYGALITNAVNAGHLEADIEEKVVTSAQFEVILAAKIAKEVTAKEELFTYAEKRAAAYPSIADQLDTIYHEGLDAWKATILAVKEANPKP